MPLVTIAQAGDIPEGTAKVIDAGGKQIALFNAGGKFYAIDNTCKHRGGPLGEGEIDGTTVTCPWHGWEYDVTSGENLDDPSMKLGCYPITIDGTNVKIDV
jgi:nitrite reductase/ring-hydroxylating ferredoxin subunit